MAQREVRASRQYAPLCTNPVGQAEAPFGIAYLAVTDGTHQPPLLKKLLGQPPGSLGTGVAAAAKSTVRTAAADVFMAWQIYRSAEVCQPYVDGGGQPLTV